MEWTGLNELREKYLSFFESKGHLRLPSFSLVPNNDKSLLLINSGMAPMKKYFTGEITPPRKRVTTCQKCIRTPDIENVGKTARHGTYFEMLGNFSFGDYFKSDVIPWAWEFCTKVMEMDPERIYISVYEEDDEAYNIWVNEMGIKPDHMVRFGKEDNFWEHGAGPCGPCSELYYDRGEKYGCGKPDCKVGCECDRYIEFWNLVFTQFENDGKGNYSHLEHPNIDTGMGLERLACISQDVDNLFEVDTVQNIMKHIMKIASVEYHKDDKVDVSLRVITDHIRSTTMMIGDGVMPSNEGRGYVLRRLLRRAARHGRLLGIKRTFLSEVAKTVIQENEMAYPNLREKEDFICKVIEAEEENFAKTIDTGLAVLEDMLKDVKDNCLSGENAFLLSDTYGFPIDLTKELLEERGMTCDEEKWHALVLEQKQRARAAHKGAGAEAWDGPQSATKDMTATDFVGYETLDTDTEIVAVLADGALQEGIGAGEKASLVLKATPFYAEGGGQVGDTGKICGKDFSFQVENTVKTPEGVYVHHGYVENGAVTKNAKVKASVDAVKRANTMRNHTAAHLLQAALRATLGTHVEQAGQLVNGEHVRFDFTHFSALTAEELTEVENKVNEAILKAQPVVTEIMPIEEAKKSGAMALFGEKYGDMVRVVRAGDTSIEFCGGTHVQNTGEIGLFKIVTETSVASGVRRIEAVTGMNALSYVRDRNALLSDIAVAMRTENVQELPKKATAALEEMRALSRELESLKAKMAAAEASDLLKDAKAVGAVQVLVRNLGDATPDTLRSMCDTVKADNPNMVAVFAGKNPEKGSITLAAAVGKEAVQNGAHAGNIVRAIAQMTGGNGGGKPDSAMAGCKDASKLDEALKAAYGIVEGLLK